MGICECHIKVLASFEFENMLLFINWKKVKLMFKKKKFLSDPRLETDFLFYLWMSRLLGHPSESDIQIRISALYVAYVASVPIQANCMQLK